MEASLEKADSSGRKEQSALQRRISDHFGVVLSIPSIFYVLLVAGFPMLYLLYLVVMQDVTHIVQEPRFVGLENLVIVLTDVKYWEYFGNTLFYTVTSVGIGFVFALGISLALNSDLPYQRVWQTMVLLPWAIPFVIGTLMWKIMFNPNFGLINFLLLESGLIADPIQWFAGKGVAFTTIILAAVWINTPLSVLILLAGLNNIPENMYEAARVDGAGVWDRFRHVTLPLLRPTIAVVLVIQTMLTLRGFDIIFAMTRGGPGDATTVIGIDIYFNLVRYGELGYAAAESVVLIAIILVVLWVLWTLLEVEYEVET